MGSPGVQSRFSSRVCPSVKLCPRVRRLVCAELIKGLEDVPDLQFKVQNNVEGRAEQYSISDLQDLLFNLMRVFNQVPTDQWPNQ